MSRRPKLRRWLAFCLREAYSVSQSTWQVPIELREEVMTQWGRRIRGAIGMGLAWGAAGFAAGALLARVPGFSSDLPFALLFAPLGFVTGIIFSGILVIEGRRGFDRLSLARFAGWGAVSGLGLSGIFVLGAALRGANAWGEFLVFGPPLALAGAVCAAGSLAVARRAERRALPGPSGDPAEAARELRAARAAIPSRSESGPSPTRQGSGSPYSDR